MNILVTGGAGFIASHLVDALIAQNHLVSVLDNFSTGKMQFMNPAAKYYKMDINDPEMTRVFEEVQPEVVYHHAAQIDIQTSLNDPVFDARVNILGTIALLEQCRKHKVKKVIYASSAAVYGTPEYLGVDERHRVDPLSFYGISKHTPEHYIRTYADLYHLEYTILRYANVYGVRQDPKGEGGVVSIFLDKLLQGDVPVIYGDGEQTRDFIYVKDIVSANLAALTKGNSIYNISCNQQLSVNDLLRMMSGILDRPLEPRYALARPADILHSRLDNRKAMEELGWEPKYSMLDGLRETCKYYRTRL